MAKDTRAKFGIDEAELLKEAITIASDGYGGYLGKALTAAGISNLSPWKDVEGLFDFDLVAAMNAAGIKAKKIEKGTKIGDYADSSVVDQDCLGVNSEQLERFIKRSREVA